MADAMRPFGSLAASLARGEAMVRVTVTATRGSVPRESGATMLVGREAITGTIGGGHLEYEAIRVARAQLASPLSAATPWLVRFPLAARLGQCCGGVITLLFDPLSGRDTASLVLAAAAEREGSPFAFVCALGVAGHMTATAHGCAGALGDAAHDGEAMALARSQLAGAPAATVHEAGDRALVVHTLRPAGFDVLVFGNGHVGRALVPMLAAVPARVRWIDARDEDFPAVVADGIDVIATDTPECELAAAPRHACVVIATHDHALDFTLVETALERDDWTYLGLIGSLSKRRQFERRLVARGAHVDSLARFVCPIGRTAAPALQGKAPGIIALAVAAEIVATRERAQASGSAVVDGGRKAAR